METAMREAEKALGITPDQAAAAKAANEVMVAAMKKGLDASMKETTDLVAELQQNGWSYEQAVGMVNSIIKQNETLNEDMKEAMLEAAAQGKVAARGIKPALKPKEEIKKAA